MPPTLQLTLIVICKNTDWISYISIIPYIGYLQEPDIWGLER